MRPVGCAVVAAALAACSPPATSVATSPSAAARAPPADMWVGAEPSAAPAVTPPPVGDGRDGTDFSAELRALFRVVACAGDDAVPSDLDERVVTEHCAKLRPKIEAYKTRYLAAAEPFLAGLVAQAAPASTPDAGAAPALPSAVVYPFGGGDLVTAITTYPDAREYTTLSLELAGDPRRIHGLPAAELAGSLARLRSQLDELIFIDDYSRSETLKRTQRGDLPGELSFFLVGLAIHGCRPVSLRYFRLEPTGDVRYLARDDIDAIDHQLAEHRKRSWTSPDFSEAFANAEIRFAARADGRDEPPRVHRHVAANLANGELARTPGVLRHLERKGAVLAMTKAASYLLWSDGFSNVRDYLLDHMVLMISDSTGIPPAFAERAGFAQETFGAFRRSLLYASPGHNAAFKKLWATQPQRKLPFRYGYRDASGSDHLLVTKKR